MSRHKWRNGGKGWWECTKCGLTKEKYFGISPIYYSTCGNELYPKATKCSEINLKRQ